MNTKISEFVLQTKPWLTRHILAEFFRAVNIYKNMDQNKASGGEIEFKKMKALTDLLYSIKEDLHILFKRMTDPQNNIFEDSAKYTPNDCELEFINTIGLLFHKTMITRELVYLRQSYEINSEDYVETKYSLEMYWVKIKALFKDGINQSKALFQNNIDNDLVLLYFFENEHYITETLEQPVESIISEKLPDVKLDLLYVKIGNSCKSQGWPDRACKLYKKAVIINNENAEANQLLAECD